MTPAQALAKLIDNAPELAGEVMPEGWGLIRSTIISDVRYDDDGDPYDYNTPNMDQLPSWFYQAVAGKLAEWLAGQLALTAARGDDGAYWLCINGGTHSGPTYFAALVEAAIAVHSSS